MNHAIVNPPVDRAKSADQVKDVFITIQKETDAGIYVSGAKVVATVVGAHALQFPRPERRDRARPRHRSRGDVHRADECAGREAVLPHLLRDDGERDGHAVRLSAVVALRRERRDLRVRQCVHPLGGRAAPPRPREAQDLLSASGFLRRLPVPGLHAASRSSSTSWSGVIAKALRATGADEFRGNQAMLGEVIAWRNLFWALTDAMAMNPTPWVDDAVLPNAAVGLELSRVRRRRLWPRQGDRGEDRRLGADLSAVLDQGFRESRDRPVSRASMCAARTASTTRSASR